MRGQPATQASRSDLAFLLRWLFLVALLPSTAINLHAQEGGTVAGIVVNTWNGTPLPGVIITVRGTTLAVQTDEHGRYQLKSVPPGDQVLRFSKSGFAAAVVTDVRVLAGQTTTVNGNLRPEFYEMEEYEVTAEEFGSQTEKILFERQQAGALMEAIGSEQFSRLGAGDAGAIVARVTGVSITDGKYAVVRGLSDRYTRTLLNGVEVPSADPYRTSPQLDLFPSAMIDRISVSKTFTPDQPGASGGGVIDIVTKSFPEKPFVKGSVGTSYNPDSNLRNDFLAAPKSSVAMIALPTAPAPLAPEFFLLTENIDKPPNAVRRGETAKRANDRRAQANEVSGLLQALGTTDFGGVEKKSPLNSSMNASAGRTVSVFGNPFGMFAGVNYGRRFELLSDYERADYGGLLNLQKRGHETKSNIKTDYGANVNLGYKLSQDHEIGFNFMLAHSVDEEARHTTFDQLVEGRTGDTLEKWQLHYTDREIQNYQVLGHHGFPFLADSKVDWTVSYATTTQDEPNHRFMNYFLSPSGVPTFGDSGLPVPHDPSRYYRNIDEQGLNVRADYTLPLGFMKEESRFKMGVLSSLVDRDFKEQYFGYLDSAGFDPANPSSYLNNPALLQYMAIYRPDIAANATNFSWARFVGFVIGRPYTAYQNVLAGYPMLDLGVFSWLRLIGGVRFERTLMQIDTRDAGSSRIDQLDLLPAASAVVTVITNLNLRLGYGETVARPSFREKAPISNYLPDEDLFADGNPNLKISSITSYDARLEWFPAPGDILSAGVFYKNLKNPIELFNVDIVDSVTWVNRDEATVKGVEFEARKSLGFITEYLKGLTLGANVALIESETKFTDNEFQNKTNSNFTISKSRPLYAQSPYIINVDLSYDHPGLGTSFTLAANMTGERIILTKAQGPDIYEHPPITLDALISQRLFKNWTVRFGVRNILNPEYRQTFGEDFDDPVRRSYKRGRTYSLAINAEF
jgi:outer membrane receptor protein involved in Fe transport